MDATPGYYLMEIRDVCARRNSCINSITLGRTHAASRRRTLYLIIHISLELDDIPSMPAEKHHSEFIRSSK